MVIISPNNLKHFLVASSDAKQHVFFRNNSPQDRTRHSATLSSCKSKLKIFLFSVIVQELCESRRGRPELSVLTSLLVSVDVKLY